MTTYIITVKIETDKPVIVGAELQELIKDAKSIKVTGYEVAGIGKIDNGMCVICGGPDWTHGARNHEYEGGNS